MIPSGSDWNPLATVSAPLLREPLLAAAVDDDLLRPSTGALSGAGPDRGSVDAVEGLTQILDEVTGCFQSDAQTNEIARDLVGRAGHAGMGHAAGVFDEALDRT